MAYTAHMISVEISLGEMLARFDKAAAAFTASEREDQGEDNTNSQSLLITRMHIFNTA